MSAKIAGSAHGARDRIDDERAAKPAAAKPLVDGEPADKALRKGRVTGQSLGLLGREDWSRRRCSSRRSFQWRRARDKTVADATANILCCQLAQVSIEDKHSAGEAGAIVSGTQRFNGKRPGHRDGMI
jgi:hypothetical protein